MDRAVDTVVCAINLVYVCMYICTYVCCNNTYVCSNRFDCSGFQKIDVHTVLCVESARLWLLVQILPMVLTSNYTSSMPQIVRHLNLTMVCVLCARARVCVCACACVRASMRVCACMHVRARVCAACAMPSIISGCFTLHVYCQVYMVMETSQRQTTC